MQDFDGDESEEESESISQDRVGARRSDRKGWEMTREAMINMGITEENRDKIWRVLSCEHFK